MLAWQRRAQAQGRKLTFINVPANVDALASLYGVDGLIGGRRESGGRVLLLRRRRTRHDVFFYNGSFPLHGPPPRRAPFA
jgi:hypothetical protein